MLTSSLRSAATTGIVALGILGLAAPAHADGELNLYSSRHYDTDERLYSAISKRPQASPSTGSRQVPTS
jgi:hypothetical protein